MKKDKSKISMMFCQELLSSVMMYLQDYFDNQKVLTKIDIRVFKIHVKMSPLKATKWSLNV